jgi:hypothetical protein
VVGTLKGEISEAEFTEDEVASANGTTTLNAQRQVYAKNSDFRYQIDLQHPPRERRSPQEDQAFDVLDEICEADLSRCPCDADGSDEQIRPLLLLGEHMLDARADSRLRIVGWPRLFGFLRWMWLTKPFRTRNASLGADR